MRDFKRHTSSEILRKLEEDGRHIWLRAFRNAGPDEKRGKLWQDAFHPEQVHSRPFFEQKLAYIHANPVRAGFIQNPEDWKYSSAGLYYREWPSAVEITPIEW